MRKLDRVLDDLAVMCRSPCKAQQVLPTLGGIEQSESLAGQAQSASMQHPRCQLEKMLLLAKANWLTGLGCVLAEQANPIPRSIN